MELIPQFSMLIIGLSGSGKSTLMKKLLHDSLLKQFTQGEETYIYIICPTCDLSGDYDDFAEKLGDKMFNYFSPEIIEGLLAEQKNIVHRYGKARAPNILLILDDCLEELAHSNAVNTLFVKGRHYKISPILLVQKMRGVNRTIRVNAKQVVLFRTSNSSEIEAFTEEYVGRRNAKNFTAILDKHFQNPYTFLWADFSQPDFKKRYLLGAGGGAASYVTPDGFPSGQEAPLALAAGPPAPAAK